MESLDRTEVGDSSNSTAAASQPWSCDAPIVLDPPYLAAQISSTLSLLERTTAHLSDFRNSVSDPDSDNLEQDINNTVPSISDLIQTATVHCHSLYRSFAELEQVMLTYSRVWDPDYELDRNPMYGPELQEHISETVEKVQALHARLALVVERGYERLSELGYTFEEEVTNLGKRVELIQEFLPIIQADLHEYLGADGLKMERGHDDDCFCPVSYSVDSVEGLREFLYMLKDEFRACTAKLAEFLPSLPDGEIKTDMQTLQVEQGRLFKCITEALTNHDSEWIDSMLGGRMAYAEFVRINAREVQQYASLWRLFNEQLDMALLRLRVGRTQEPDSNGLPALESSCTQQGGTRAQLARLRDTSRSLSARFKMEGVDA